MNVSFTAKAETDLDAVFSYLAADDAEMAGRIIARILQSVAMLERFPLLGRVGRVPRTRELPIVRLRYYVVYRLIDETEIEVIAVMHERQRFP